MYCEHCGKELPDRARYCRFCGAAQEVVPGSDAGERATSLTDAHLSGPPGPSEHGMQRPPDFPLVSGLKVDGGQTFPEPYPYPQSQPVVHPPRKRRYLWLPFVLLAVFILAGAALVLFTSVGKKLGIDSPFLRDKIATETSEINLFSPNPSSSDLPEQSLSLPETWVTDGDDRAVLPAVTTTGSMIVETTAPSESATLSVVAKELKLAVKQVDVTNFPTVRLYLDIRDESGTIPKDLEGGMFLLSEKRAHDSEYIKRSIERVVQLNEQEQINIHLVADISGSMWGEPIDEAIVIMRKFLENVQFGIGDKIQLTAFHSFVMEIQRFTPDKSLLQSALDRLWAEGETALYDALYYAIHSTALQEGAKCIIAFTDGEDNCSSVSYETVIADSQHFGIPIFIIGVDVDEVYGRSVLQDICDRTGGSYSSIKEIDTLESIYEQVYRAQKEQYLIEYISEADDSKMSDQFEVQINLQSGAYSGKTDFSFEPHLLLDVNTDYSGQDEIESILASYLKGFISAMQTKQFSDLSWTLIKDSPIYVEQERYIKKDAHEELISYEILAKNINGDECTLLVRENYYIESKRAALHMMTQIAHYRLYKTSEGWRFHSFVEPVKVVEKIYQ